MIIKSIMQLVGEARQQIENLMPAQVFMELEQGHAVLIDIRDEGEIAQSGQIAGSVHASRGMLEFHADASLPNYKPEFRKDKRIILHCTSGARSALAVMSLKQLGFQNVAHMEGGLQAWREAGFPVLW